MSFMSMKNLSSYSYSESRLEELRTNHIFPSFDVMLGNPGVDSDLPSRFRQVSRSEAMRMLQFLDRIRNEGNACEDLVEKLAIEDGPGQNEAT